MRRLVHCPFVAEEVVLVVNDFETLLEVVVVDLLLETVEEVEDFTLLLVLDEIVESVEDFVLLVVDEDFVLLLAEDFTVLLTVEEVFELLLVDDTVLPTLLLDLTLAHTNCVCPSSQAPLMLNDSKTMLSIAFRFAPVKALNRTVYVCVDPVIPVNVVK
jgi:hypothetical protein